MFQYEFLHKACARPIGLSMFCTSRDGSITAIAQNAFKVSRVAQQHLEVLPKLTNPSPTLPCFWAAVAKLHFSVIGNLRINDSSTSVSHVAAWHRWQGMHTRDTDREKFTSSTLSFIHYNVLLQTVIFSVDLSQIPQVHTLLAKCFRT